MKSKTIYTVTANCQDCYRCVRACPVKAIKVRGGQARVVDELCIKCGTCVRECPQHAKMILSTLEDAKTLLREKPVVVASIAPSFVAAFGQGSASRLPSALRRLGFRHVGETARGAKYITDKSFANDGQGGICTACPAVVNYIETYRPDMIDALIPVVSPMIAHARLLKAEYPGCAVVFIGPCAAKKQEALRPENAGAVDAVLTFVELKEWLAEEQIRLENCAESAFENSGEIGAARLFPIQGGMLKTGGISSDVESASIVHVSGVTDVMDLLQNATPNWKYQYVEPLFCKGGCVGGPAIATDSNLLSRRQDVIAYANKAPAPDKKDTTEVAYNAAFSPVSIDSEMGNPPSAKEIQKILELTGKSNPATQLNCGACGYKSCLENAAAVASGMAELDMCLPYIRRLSQQRTDKIIETTPNGIVVLDGELTILRMNPAFQKMFLCNNGILGRKISYLVNTDGFEQLVAGKSEIYESVQTKYGIRYHEILYALREDNQYVGIYADISKLKYDSKQLDLIKSQTLLHAREFLDHQISFAQEMAHYLGKSTAKSEELAKRIIDLYEPPETSATYPSESSM